MWGHYMYNNNVRFPTHVFQNKFPKLFALEFWIDAVMTV